MNPSWIRKHEDHVPCVIVLFLRLEADASAAFTISAAHDTVVGGKEEVEAGLNATRATTTAGTGTSMAPPGPSRKERDEALVAEISERRKKWTDRVPGAKVTVVLLASKEMLGKSPPSDCTGVRILAYAGCLLRADDPSLDTRLSAIRRHSGLDTKSSLYVLTPVAADDLDDFVQR